MWQKLQKKAGTANKFVCRTCFFTGLEKCFVSWDFYIPLKAFEASARVYKAVFLIWDFFFKNNAYLCTFIFFGKNSDAAFIVIIKLQPHIYVCKTNMFAALNTDQVFFIHLRSEIFKIFSGIPLPLSVISIIAFLSSYTEEITTVPSVSRTKACFNVFSKTLDKVTVRLL